jgi:hypothetical protein
MNACTRWMWYGKVFVHGEFSNKGNIDRYLQKLQFFVQWFLDLLPLFSKCELPYWEFELIEAFRDLTPVERRTQIRSVAGEVW